MRVVVAAPQVPFVRGGAELMAEDLVAALRARGHEAEIVSIPFKWYPGSRVLDQAFLWRLVDLTESDGRPIDRVIATKFPAYCVRHPEQGRVGAAPVPAGVRLRPHRARPVRRVAGGPRDAPCDRAPRRGRARRGAQSVRDVAQRRRPAAALQRDHRGGAAAPAAVARRIARPSPRATSSRSTGSTARSGSTCSSRPRSASPSLRIVIAGEGPDRERLERLAIGAQRPGDVRRPRRRGASSPISTRAASPSITRRSTRTSGWFRTRRSCRRSPSSPPSTPAARSRSCTTARPARSSSPTPPRSRGPAPISPRTSTRRRRGAAPGRALAERVTWDACVDALLS